MSELDDFTTATQGPLDETFLQPVSPFGPVSTADALNILAFEPILLDNGDLDITSSLQDALDAVPVAFDFLHDNPQNAATILFPTLGEKTYVLREPVDVPGDRNVRLAATSPFGARIELRLPQLGGGESLDSGLRPALQSLAGRRAHVFENLIFRGGGVTIGGGGDHDAVTLGMTEFRSCVFVDITNPGAGDSEERLKWALSTAAPGVVGVRVLNCQFLETDHGVGVLHNACDNWIIGHNSRFVRMRGVGVEIRSSGVTVRDARFEDKLIGAGSRPYVRIRGFGRFDGGLSEITGCRFGGEVGLDLDTKKELDGPPRSAIEIGPNTTTEDEDVDAPLVAVVVTRNRFLGRGRSTTAAKQGERGGPTESSAKHAISLLAPVRHTVVAENHFRRYFDELIEETEIAGPKSRDNLFVGNAVERQKTPDGRPYPGIVSNDGESWQTWPPGQDLPLG